VIVNAGTEEARITVGIPGSLLIEVIDNFIFALAVVDLKMPIEEHILRQIADQIFFRFQSDRIEHFTALGI